MQSDILDEVLFVGPDHSNHRGGIGAVLEAYHAFLQPFRFIPSYQPFKSNTTKFTYFFRQLHAIHTELKNNPSVRIVHIHGSHRASFYRKYVLYLLAKKIYKRKIIYHIHSSCYDVFYKGSNPLQKILMQKFVNGADLLVCLSPTWKHFFETSFRPRRIQIINNVVLKPQVAAINKPVVENRLQLLFLGRIGQRKGVYDLIQIFEKNKAFYRGKIVLYLGGDGEVEMLETQIREKGLQDIVKYTGWVTAEKKAALLRTSDIYILPSYNEGLPISILEAMSYGLPVIATNIGGIPEVVKDGYNGFITNPGDIAAIEKAIRYFIEQPHAATEFGKHSLQIVEPYYPENVKQQLLKCYQSLLQNSVYEPGFMVSQPA